MSKIPPEKEGEHLSVLVHGSAHKKQIGIVTSQEKWQKGQDIVNKWISQVHLGAMLNRKELERDRGFLVHISMVCVPEPHTLFERVSSYNGIMATGQGQGGSETAYQ